MSSENNIENNTSENNGETNHNGDTSKSTSPSPDTAAIVENGNTNGVTKPREMFVVEISGLPASYDVAELKKLLNYSLQLNSFNIRKDAFGRNIVYVQFPNENKQFKAVTVLNSYKWQGAVLTAAVSDRNKDPVFLNKIGFLTLPKAFWKLPLEERVEKALLHHHKKEYDAQLKRKQTVVSSLFGKYSGKVSAPPNNDLSDFLYWQRNRRRGKILEIDAMVPSEVKEGYLNACEFAIGKDKDSEEPIVGYRIANYESFELEMAPAGQLPHLSDKVKEVVGAVKDFVASSSFDPWDPFTMTGVWRSMIVRYSTNGELLLLLQVHTPNLEDSDYEVLKGDFCDHFIRGEGATVGVTSLFLSKLSKLKHSHLSEVDMELVYGQEYIEETFLGHTMRVPPNAYLEGNTSMVDVINRHIIDAADVDTDTTVIDVNSDIGVAAVALAQKAKRVVCVEPNTRVAAQLTANLGDGASDEVSVTAEKNEKKIKEILAAVPKGDSITAIMRTRSAGADNLIMKSLRASEKVTRIICVTSDVSRDSGLMLMLTSTKMKAKKSFFVPIRAATFDVEPFTEKYVAVVEFELYNETKWNRIFSGNPRPVDMEYYNRIPEEIHQAAQRRKERQEQRKKNRARAYNSRPAYAGPIWAGTGSGRGGMGGYGGPMSRGGYNSAYGNGGVGLRGNFSDFGGAAGPNYHARYTDSYAARNGAGGDVYGYRPGESYNTRPYMGDHRSGDLRDRLGGVNRPDSGYAGGYSTGSQLPRPDGYYTDGYHRGYMAGLEAVNNRGIRGYPNKFNN